MSHISPKGTFVEMWLTLYTATQVVHDLLAPIRRRNPSAIRCSYLFYDHLSTREHPPLAIRRGAKSIIHINSWGTYEKQLVRVARKRYSPAAGYEGWTTTAGGEVDEDVSVRVSADDATLLPPACRFLGRGCCRTARLLPRVSIDITIKLNPPSLS